MPAATSVYSSSSAWTCGGARRCGSSVISVMLSRPAACPARSLNWTARPPGGTCAPRRSPVPARNPADALKILFGHRPASCRDAYRHHQSRPRTATCGPPAGRTPSPGSCLAAPPARPGRPWGAVSVDRDSLPGWLAGARIVLSPAGSARGSSPVRSVLLKAAAAVGFRLAAGGECHLGGRVGVGGGEVWHGAGMAEGHPQRVAGPGQQEQQGQREVGPYQRCHGRSPARRVRGSVL